MHIVTTKEALNLLLQEKKNKGEIIGFVPTMGALHDGHLSLITTAKTYCSVIVCSVFVNPTQFNNVKDLEKYPRTLEKDTQLLENIGCDILFCPDESELYPKKTELTFNFGALENVLEGEFRPGHFNGVGLVVSKLFNIVLPHHAFFGQKDLQQFLIINRLVEDLCFNITLHCCAIKRESDGLAMSSRNVRLNHEFRAIAPQIYKSLELGKKLIHEKIKFEDIYKQISEFYLNHNIQLEYYKIVNAENLSEIKEIQFNQKIAICVACVIDEVRLIDNIILNA
jgi:pantoate--beta-alanine ligase